uniref:Uncharacterized protein n=1 Tax=Ananas comosus var. bracteatus TaxID=296719 RepID=A0A6V7P8Y2_ANACO|nr:unnamed protein product [Ananas comosus var. bracteatus]
MAFEAFLNSLEHGVGGGGDVLTKVGVFVLVQALVYLILTKSSNIFSSCSSSSSFSVLRSLSFRPSGCRASAACSPRSPTFPQAPTIPPRQTLVISFDLYISI